nr:hypothetical protein GCM10017611_32800 [Rhodococcus wratislaviensis]
MKQQVRTRGRRPSRRISAQSPTAHTREHKRTHEEELVDFAWRWRHWDIPPEADIFVQFGLAPAEFYRRLMTVLTGPQRGCVPLAVREHLQNLSRSQLHPPTKDGRRHAEEE